MEKWLPWVVVVWCLVFNLPAHGASFDCGKAATKVEKLVCADPDLSKLDEDLAAVYKTALQDETQAETIRQAQKQWIKDRNGCNDAECVRRAYEARLQALTSPATSKAFISTTQATPVPAPDKPGLFKLDQSTNDAVCVPLGQLINKDIEKYGKIRFEKHNEFVKWQEVEEKNVDRGAERKYTESVERADVDINNDGVVDQVVRTRWSLRYVLQDKLDVIPLSQQRVIIDELLNSEKRVEFNAGNYWMNRRIAKYGEGNYDWAFDGVASLNLFQQNGEVYVVAQNYAAPRNVSAKTYVFQLDKDHVENDVCMFVKICPCGGCEDLRADEVTKTLPAKKWCK